jgi:hypothetical protein
LNKVERRGLAAAAEDLQMARAERDREAAGRAAAVAEVQRLREEIVRLQAQVDTLLTAEAAKGRGQGSRMRGLASLIAPAAHELSG